MPDNFSYDFTDWLRRSEGAGIGQVAGSKIDLRVNFDVGSTWYALDAEPERVKAAFERHFGDFDLAREHNMHSMAAGTTIEFIITGLSLGAGIVATEFLKEAGKFAWKVFSTLLPQKERQRDDVSYHGDTVTFNIVINDKNISSHINLPSSTKGLTSEELLKTFCENALVDLYLRELDTAARIAPLSERLEVYKRSKHHDRET